MTQLTLQEIQKERDILLGKIKNLVIDFEQLTNVIINEIYIKHTPMFAGQFEEYIGSVVSDIQASINYEEHCVKGLKQYDING